MNSLVYTNTQQAQLRRLIPDLIRGRELLRDLVLKDVKVRYRYAAMGLLWAVLEPLFMMLVLTFVFSIVFRTQVAELGIDTGREYAVFILSGLVPWQFFSTALSTATRSLVDNRALVKKVYFAREIIPLSAIGVATVNLAIGTLLFAVVHGALIGTPHAAAFLWLPVVLLIELSLVVGLALLCSCAHAAFRDVGHIVDAALLFGFYATPIFYWPGIVREALAERGLDSYYTAYLANPMAGIVTVCRQALFAGTVDATLLVWPAVAAALALVIGAAVFRRRTALLADAL